MATVTVRSKTVVLLSLIHCLLLFQLCGSRCCILVVLCSFCFSDHVMHVRRWLLDFGRAIVVVDLFIVAMFHDLTTEPI